MPERRKSIGDYISVITITVLFVVILSLVVFAARGYQFAQDMQDSSSNTRAVLSYVINSVRDSDATSISVEDRSGTECLVLAGDGYEQRIYCADGVVYEEYVDPGNALDPENALRIGEADTFELEIGADGILEVATDAGSSYVNTQRHR